VSADAYHLGLTGYPLDHSLSPRLHAAALQACGLQGEYRLYPVPPEDETGLGELLERVRSGALHGLNVTIPHKRSVLPLLDRVSQMARAIGAVNTIYARDEALLGENTDAAGFLSDLGCVFPAAAPGAALVLGAGGSARAVVYALLQAGWQVCVAARRLEQAKEISERVEVLRWNAAAMRQIVEEQRVELLVNTTPLGMGHQAGESAWPQGVRLPGMAFVYDLVYNPPETALLQAARQAGLGCANGLGMLVEQARLAFKLWTGREVAREVMEKAVKDEYRGGLQSRREKGRNGV
jgi:shikimate dehydrogenase